MTLKPGSQRKIIIQSERSPFLTGMNSTISEMAIDQAAARRVRPSARLHGRMATMASADTRPNDPSLL